MKFRSRADGSHYPVHGKTLFGPPRDTMLAQRISIADASQASSSTDYLSSRYNRAGSRGERRRLVLAANQAANRARVISRNPNLSMEQRMQAHQASQIYRGWVDQHRLTPKDTRLNPAVRDARIAEYYRLRNRLSTLYGKPDEYAATQKRLAEVEVDLKQHNIRGVIGASDSKLERKMAAAEERRHKAALEASAPKGTNSVATIKVPTREHVFVSKQHGPPNTISEGHSEVPPVGGRIYFYDENGNLKSGTRFRAALVEGGITGVELPDGRRIMINAPGSRAFGEKGEVSYGKAKELHEQRSAHAIAVDNALHAKTVYPRGQDDYSGWAKRKNRTDVEGIDIRALRQTEGREPLKVKKLPKVKPATKAEAAEHPFVLRGDPKVVEKFQPIIDDKFADLKNHPVSPREITVFEEPPDPKDPNVGGYFSVRFLDATTGRPVRTEDITYADITSGRVIVRPEKIVISTAYTGSPDRNNAVIHEFSHMRRLVQEDAKLRKLITDKDREEKENVLETYARQGGSETSATEMPNYYGGVPAPYPQSALDDQETLGTYTAGGLTTDTPRIERSIHEGLSKTKLGKVDLERLGAVRRSPPALRGVRYGVQGKGIVKPEQVDSYFITSEGDYYHIYSPRGNITQKQAAKFADAEDRVKGEEKVWEFRDGKKVRVL